MAPPEPADLKLEPGENGDASKENMDPLTQDLQVRSYYFLKTRVQCIMLELINCSDFYILKH